MEVRTEDLFLFGGSFDQETLGRGRAASSKSSMEVGEGSMFGPGPPNRRRWLLLVTGTMLQPVMKIPV